MTNNLWYPKQNPFLSLQSMGGGAASYFFKSSGFSPDFSYGSVVNGLEDSSTNNTAQNPKVSADPHDENRYVIAFTDDDGSKDGYIRIITRDGNSMTMSPVYDAADSSNNSQTCAIFDPSNSGKLIYVYYDGKMRGRVISFSGSAGSETFSRSSDTQMSNLNFTGNPGVFVPMGSTGRYLVPTLQSTVCKVRIFTASSSSITSYDSAGGSDAISMTTTSSTPPSIAVDPTDSTKGMMCTVNTSEKLVVRDLTFSGSGTSANVSVGAETQLTPGTLSGGGYPQNQWHSLVACGAGKYVAFARGGDSPHDNKVVGVAFDFDGSSYTLGSATYAPQNITTGEPGTWRASNNLYSANNTISLVGNYGTIGGYKPMYGSVCTRSDDRTLSYTDVTLIAANEVTGLYRNVTAQGYDDANTNLSVISNNFGGSAYDNLSGILWQAGNEGD